jgi:hypothetical protein
VVVHSNQIIPEATRRLIDIVLVSIMSGSSSFGDRVERLRIMLGDLDVWEEQEHPKTEHRLVLVPQPEPPRDTKIFSDPDDGEKIISIDHMIGGRLRELYDSSESNFTDSL